MAVADYKKYLAEAVLNDRRTKSGSVHATYIVTGIPTPAAPPAPTNGAHADATNGHDAMPSSPYLSSSMPNPEDVAGDAVPTWSVVLVREEDLDDAKASFESISFVYVYSLEPATLQDLNVLADVRQEMLSTYGKDDPLELGAQWGMIQSKTVKRRTGMRPPIPTPEPKTVPAKRPAQEDKPQKKPEPEPKKEESGSEKPSKPSTRESTPASSKPTEKTAPAKREKGSLFSSFAKAKPKQKKEEPATPAPAVDQAEPSGAEDVVLDDASEEEAEELFPETGKPTASNRETRKEREEKLRQMMEDSEDEEMPDTTEPPEEESTPIDEPPPKTELKEEATVQGGRRRGKRQVMKKKTVKDEEGYLVTVEEPAWESFSEDEAPPPKKKPAVSAPKKGGVKAGQGNIMSFFGKK
ncbi:hypothetical protein ATERTT37_000082 [Aspergillus terreus]